MDSPNHPQANAAPVARTRSFVKGLRTFAGFVLLTLLMPMVAEFGIKLAEEQEIYTRPTDKVRAAAAVLTAFVSDPLYQIALTFAAGLAAGVWLDVLARRLDRRRAKPIAAEDSGAAPVWSEPYRPISVVGKNFRNERVVLDGHAYSGCEFVNVQLVYKGTTPVQFSSNRHSGTWISFENDAIGSAVSLLMGLGWMKEGLPIEMPLGNFVSAPPPALPAKLDPSV